MFRLFNLLICLAPLVCGIVLLVFMLPGGPPGENKNGPNPKGTDNLFSIKGACS